MPSETDPIESSNKRRAIESTITDNLSTEMDTRMHSSTHSSMPSSNLSNIHGSMPSSVPNASDPYWPPSLTIDVNDEEAAVRWAIAASLEDARRRALAKEHRRIPGVVDVLTRTTRGPSLLGAAPGVCSSPAKAEGPPVAEPEATFSGSLARNQAVSQIRPTHSTKDLNASLSASGEEDHFSRLRHPAKRQCLDDRSLDKQRMAVKKRPRDDLMLDRKRLKNAASEMSAHYPVVVAVVAAEDAPT
jgi:hypothetical protein